MEKPTREPETGGQSGRFSDGSELLLGAPVLGNSMAAKIMIIRHGENQ